MAKRAMGLLPILLFLSACCLDVIDGHGGIGGITSGEITGGTTGGTGGADSGPPVACPQAGTCASDGDCVVAWCASEACGGCDHFAVSQSLLSENPCLVDMGAVDGPTSGQLSPACRDVVQVGCDCFAHPYCVPRCSSGMCACADAGP